MNRRATVTLERLLDEVLYKEDVQGLLEELGESTSGDKPELIERFLNSEKTRSRRVDTIVREILEQAPYDDLMDFGSRLGLKMPRAKKTGVRHLMKEVRFEPYIREVERNCPVCSGRTAHDLHFTPEWRASFFRCRICNNKIAVDEVAGANDEAHTGQPQPSTPAEKNPESTNLDLSRTLGLVEDIASSVRRSEEGMVNMTIRLKTLPLEGRAEGVVLNQTPVPGQGGKGYTRGELWDITGIVVAIGGLVTAILGAVYADNGVIYIWVGIPVLAIGVVLLLFGFMKGPSKE